MPIFDQAERTTESTHEAEPSRLRAPYGEASTALESGPARLQAPTSTRRQTTTLGVPAFGLLPGEFAIRTYLKNTYLTARDGGRHSIDAVVTAATTLGPNEKFKLTTIQPDYTSIQTPQGYYVSAVGEGGRNFPPGEVLQTERTSLADDALFVLGGPGAAGGTNIETFNGHFLTALGGGGKTTDAFHTDATGVSTWETFWVLKSGDLGSGYRYAIRPMGTGGPGEVVNFLTAAGGGGRPGFQDGEPPVTHYSGLFADSQFTLVALGGGSYALQTRSGNYVTAVGGGASPTELTSIPMQLKSKPGRNSKLSTRGTLHTPFKPSAAFTLPSRRASCSPQEESPHGSVTPMRPRRLAIPPSSN
jgi:hypothetical protein